MNKKLDIMNSRKDESWIMVDGKVQKVEKVKVAGPVVTNGIKEFGKVKVKKKKGVYYDK